MLVLCTQRRFLSGLLIGVGFGLKIFPYFILDIFCAKEISRHLLEGLLGQLGAAIASVAVFGWQANRVFVNQVLPWALRGEGMDPYNLSSASIATLLHRLFIYEPQWNPNPSIHAAWLFAVLLPLAQTLLFAPALLLAEPGDNNPQTSAFEWSAVLLGSLAISTLPAGYHFTLLILPVCLMWNGSRNVVVRPQLRYFLLLYVRLDIRGGKRSEPCLLDIIQCSSTLYRRHCYVSSAYWLLGIAEARCRTKPRHVVMGGSIRLVDVAKYRIGLTSSERAVCGLSVATSNVGRTCCRPNGPVTQNDTILFTAMVPAGYRTAAQKHDGI